MLRKIPVSLWFVLLVSTWSIWSFISSFKISMNVGLPTFLSQLFAMALKVAIIAGILRRWSWTWKYGIASGIYSLGLGCFYWLGQEGLKSIFLAGLQGQAGIYGHATPEQLASIANVVIKGMVAISLVEGALFVAVFWLKRSFFSKGVADEAG